MVREVFEGNNNYMKSGTNLRKVLNKLNEIDFNPDNYPDVPSLPMRIELSSTNSDLKNLVESQNLPTLQGQRLVA